MKRGLSPPVIVLDPNDVVLAEIAAGLQHDQLQFEILQPMRASIGKTVEIDNALAYLLQMIRKVFIITSWLALAFIVFATLSPIEDRPVFANPHLEHFIAFALMGLAFGFAYPSRTFFVVAVVLGSAVGLEALQLLTPDRHGRVLDAAVKAIGGISGMTVSYLTPLIWRFIQSRAPNG